MDLVNFTEGVQSIRIQENEQAPINNSAAKRFVPLGDPVVQHTDTLFSDQSSNQELLESLIFPSVNASFDPNEYEATAILIQAALQKLKQQLIQTMDSRDSRPLDQHNSFEQSTASTLKTLQRALVVLNALKVDRDLLQTNLTALEKV